MLGWDVVVPCNSYESTSDCQYHCKGEMTATLPTLQVLWLKEDRAFFFASPMVMTCSPSISPISLFADILTLSSLSSPPLFWLLFPAAATCSPPLIRLRFVSQLIEEGAISQEANIGEALLAVTTELESNMKWGRVCPKEIHVRKYQFTAVASKRNHYRRTWCVPRLWAVEGRCTIHSLDAALGSIAYYSLASRSCTSDSEVLYITGLVWIPRGCWLGWPKCNFLLEELWSDFPSCRVPAHPAACGSSPHSPSPTTAEGATYLLWDPQ